MTQKDFVKMQKDENNKRLDYQMKEAKKLKNNFNAISKWKDHLINTKFGQTPKCYTEAVISFFKFHDDKKWSDCEENEII